MAESKKTTFEVVAVYVDDEGVRVQIGSWSDELDDGGVLTVLMKRFDEEANRFVDDPLALARADERVKEAFRGVTLGQVLEDPSAIMGALYEGYLSEESGRVYLTPPPAIVDFAPLDDAAAAAIAARFGSEGGTTTPFGEAQRHGIGRNSGEPYSMYQFEVGVALEVAGEEKVYRVSRFVKPADTPGGREARVGMRFDDRFATEQYALFDSGAFDDHERAVKALKTADRMVTRRRNDVAARFKEVTGRDVDELIDSGAGVEFDHIELGVVEESGARYLICHMPPAAVPPADPEGADFDDDDDIPF